MHFERVNRIDQTCILFVYHAAYAARSATSVLQTNPMYTMYGNLERTDIELFDLDFS